MKEKLFLIEYENAHWCGGKLHCVVKAMNAGEAETLAEPWMIETQLDLFNDNYEEEPELEEDIVYTVNNIEEFNSEHNAWEYFLDEVQRGAYYPCVNFSFEDEVK